MSDRHLLHGQSEQSEITPEALRLLREAAQLAGHGLHPDKVLVLARRYLNVPLVPGSVVTDAEVANAEAAVRVAAQRYDEGVEIGYRRRRPTL